MMVSLRADWNDLPESREAFGYTLTVRLQQLSPDFRCRQLPASARFTLNGQELGPLAFHAPTGCVDVELALGPLVIVDDPVTIRWEEGGRQLGEAVYPHLTPGVFATLAVPADGQVQAGGELVIVPPSELPTSNPGYPHFYPMDDAAASSWISSGVRPNGGATRQPDGIHVPVPATMAGAVAVVVDGMPVAPHAPHSCDGFAGCYGYTADVVGPFYLMVQP